MITQTQAEFAKESLSEVFTPEGDAGHVIGFRKVTNTWLVEVEAYGDRKFYQPAVIAPSQALIKLLMRDYPNGHPSDCLRCEAKDSPINHMYYPASLPNEHRYRAFNGHMMAAHVRGYNRDGTMAYEQFSAWHADDCHCDGTETLPAW